jgi:tetratricopeptide (TPR) repeat protein
LKNAALELDPNHLFAFMALIEAYTLSGQYAQAETVLLELPREFQQHLTIRARAGLYYAAVGDYEKAEEVYRALVDSLPTTPVLIASELALALGNTEEAIDIMELVAEKKVFTLPWIRNRYRHNKAVENHPRYLALLEHLGLDDKSVAELQIELGLN